MSRVNHNAQYIYDLEGETVWEKLRVIRNQLTQRKIAYQLAELSKEKSEQQLDKNSFEYREYLIQKEQNEELIQDCVNEIKFLTGFESALAEQAEKTRIPGKTDDEMYEINFFEELKLRLVKSAQAQLISCGRLSDETISRILKNRPALELCIQLGLLAETALQISNQTISPLPENYEILHLENLKKES